MRLKLSGCFLIAVFTLGISGCDLALGGSKSKPSGPQPTALSVGIKPNNTQCTKVSPCGFSVGTTNPLQLEATATFSDGSTQNYTTEATWAASPANIVTLSQSSGIETVTGTAVGTTTITATSTNNLTATAVVTVNPAALSYVTVTPAGNGMAVGATANYTATAVFSDGSTQNVTTTSSWASSTDGVAGVGTTSGTVSAAAPGQTNISATYEGVTGTTALNVVAASGAYSNASLSGYYTFTLTNTGTNSTQASVPQYFVGSLSFDGKGNVTGVMDRNTGSGIATNVAVTGTVSVFADGRGTLTLNGTGLPSSTYRLILTSNLWGTLSGQFIQFDGKGSAIGTLAQQASGWTIGGNEVFRLTGVDTGANPLGEVGVFGTSGTSIISGEFDENDFDVIDQNSNPEAPVVITGGSYATPGTNGRGTLQLITSARTSNFVYYKTESGNMVLMSTDASAPILFGYGEAQSGTFTAASLNGGYGFLLERSPALGRGLFETTGRIAFNGNGAVSGGAQDGVSGEQNDSINSGTYSVSSNGRTAITVSTTDFPTLNYVYYLVSTNRAYVLELNDPSAAAGTVDIQTGITQSPTILSGNYGFAAADLSDTPSTSVVMWMSANAAGSATGVGDVVTGPSLSSLILSSTYTVADPIGRTVVLPTATVGAQSYIFYVVSPCESYMLGVVPSFDGTMLNQSSTTCQ